MDHIATEAGGQLTVAQAEWAQVVPAGVDRHAERSNLGTLPTTTSEPPSEFQSTAFPPSVQAGSPSVPCGTPATPPATPPLLPPAPTSPLQVIVAAEEDEPQQLATQPSQAVSNAPKKRKLHVLVPKKVVQEVKEPEIVLALGGVAPRPKFKPPVLAPKPSATSDPALAQSASPLAQSTISALPQPSSGSIPPPSSTPAIEVSLSQSVARKKLAKPFKVPLAPAKPPPTPLLSSDPPSSAFLPTSPPSTSFPPSELDHSDAPSSSGPAVTQSAARKTLAKPFRTPLAPINGQAPSAPAAKAGAKRGAELAGLQRRAQVLRQAVKYEKAREAGGQDSDAELERLCDKWKEAGKLAAEFLWAHAPKIDPTFRDAGGDDSSGLGGSWGFDNGGATGGGGGFASSWGFATDTRQPDANPFATSWGFGPPTPLPSIRREETLADFKQRVRDEARESARTVQDVMDELNAGELPGVEELIGRVGVEGRKRAGRDEGVERGEEKRARADDEEEVDEYALELEAERLMGVGGRTAEELDEEEVERRARELMAQSEADTARAMEEGEGDQPDIPEGAGKEDEEDVAEEKLTLGRLMRVVGVEPGMFGWDDDLEDFV